MEATWEISRATRTHAPLTVLIADLDRFKEVNDQHGHLVGDQVLAAAAAALQSGSRSYDVLGRFGGEEFTIALPGADLDEAIQITARLRQLVADAAVPVGPDCVQVTVSIGAAVLGRHGQDLTGAETGRPERDRCGPACASGRDRGPPALPLRVGRGQPAGPPAPLSHPWPG